MFRGVNSNLNDCWLIRCLLLQNAVKLQKQQPAAAKAAKGSNMILAAVTLGESPTPKTTPATTPIKDSNIPPATVPPPTSQQQQLPPPPPPPPIPPPKPVQAATVVSATAAAPQQQQPTTTPSTVPPPQTAPTAASVINHHHHHHHFHHAAVLQHLNPSPTAATVSTLRSSDTRQHGQWPQVFVTRLSPARLSLCQTIVGPTFIFYSNLLTSLHSFLFLTTNWS